MNQLKLAALFEEFREQHLEFLLEPDRAETLRRLETGELMELVWTDFRARASDPSVGRVLAGALHAKNVAAHNTTVPGHILACETQRDQLRATVSGFLKFADQPQPDLVDDKGHPDSLNRIAAVRASLIDLQRYLELRYEDTILTLQTKTPRSNKRAAARATFSRALSPFVVAEIGIRLDSFVGAAADTLFPEPEAVRGSNKGREPDTAAAVKQARYRERRKVAAATR